MTTEYLRNFVESVSGVPEQLHRTFKGIRELDERAERLSLRLEADRIEQLRRLGEAGSQAAKRAKVAAEGGKAPADVGKAGRDGGGGTAAGGSDAAAAGPTAGGPAATAAGSGAGGSDVPAAGAGAGASNVPAAGAGAGAPGLPASEAAALTSEELSRRIAEASAEVLRLSSEKTDAAQQAYDLIDGIIRGLDADLEAFDQELAASMAAVAPPAAPAAGGAGGRRSRGGAGARRGGGSRAGAGAAAAVVAVAPPEPPKPMSDEEAYQAALAAADPGEPTYCTCHRISFGEMVACENPDCPIEWFHFGCVGLTPETRPTGPWYCEDCKKKLGIK